MKYKIEVYLIRYILRNDVLQFEYVITNENFETIVMLHGIGLDMTCWDLILPYIKDKYNDLRYDFRGHGLVEVLGKREGINFLPEYAGTAYGA